MRRQCCQCSHAVDDHPCQYFDREGLFPPSVFVEAGPQHCDGGRGGFFFFIAVQSVEDTRIPSENWSRRATNKPCASSPIDFAHASLSRVSWWLRLEWHLCSWKNLQGPSKLSRMS